jgi:thiol:disulfide interchange protein DsbD
MHSNAAKRNAAAAVATLFLFAVPGGSAGPRADTSQNEIVSARLVADVNAIVPGEPFRLGVMLDIEPGWTVNWINPGEAGLAPSTEWQLPDGFKAGMTVWPHPERFTAGPATVFGYEGGVLLWTEVTSPTDLADASRLRLVAGVSWVACGDGFVPGRDELALTLPVSSTAAGSDDAALFEEAERRSPSPSHSWRARGYYQDDHTIVVDLESGDDTALSEVFLYPYEPGVIDCSRPQLLSRLEVGDQRGGYRLLVPRDPVAAGSPWLLRAVLVARSGWGGPGPAIEVEIPMGP